MEDGALFCDECGAALQQEVNVQKKISVEESVTETTKKSKSEIAAFVLGIISLCSCGLLFIPQIVGLVLGIVAIQNEKGKKHGLAIAGIIMSVISMAIILLFFVVGLLSEVESTSTSETVETNESVETNEIVESVETNKEQTHEKTKVAAKMEQKVEEELYGDAVLEGGLFGAGAIGDETRKLYAKTNEKLKDKLLPLEDMEQMSQSMIIQGKDCIQEELGEDLLYIQAYYVIFNTPKKCKDYSEIDVTIWYQYKYYAGEEAAGGPEQYAYAKLDTNFAEDYIEYTSASNLNDAEVFDNIIDNCWRVVQDHGAVFSKVDENSNRFWYCGLADGEIIHYVYGNWDMFSLKEFY